MIRIVLAEDQAMVRGALSALLGLEPDIDVLGAAADGEAAWRMLQQLQPDILVTDIEMPGLSGLELAQRIAGRATFIEFHLIVDADMTVRESHVICDRIEDALRAEIPSVRVIIHVEPDDEAKLPKGTVAVPFA